jgi:hypothetical protein
MDYLEFRRNNHLQNNLKNNDSLFISHLTSNSINLDKALTKPDSRIYKDQSTSDFNNIFLRENHLLNLFTFYNYQKMNYDIMSNINYKLNFDKEILRSDEHIYFVFKGGNVIGKYINDIINKVNRTNFTNFIKDNLNLLKISDTDFTIYILNEGEKKYNLIYKYVSDLLYASLIEIRNNFEKLLIHRLDGNNNNLFPDVDLNNIIDHIEHYNYRVIHLTNIPILNIDIQIQKELEKIKNYEENQANNQNINNIFINSINSIIIILRNNNIIEGEIRNENITFSIYEDIYTSSIYIKILQSIQFYIRKFINSRGIQHRQNQTNYVYRQNNLFSHFFRNINDIIQNQRTLSNASFNKILFRLNNYYTMDKINLFLRTLINNLNNDDANNGTVYKKNIYYDKNINTSEVKYKMEIDNDIIKQQLINIDPNSITMDVNNIYYIHYQNRNVYNPTSNNIMHNIPTVYLKKRGDTIAKNINDIKFTEILYSDNDKKYHYITVNSSINNLNNGSNHIISFYLYRIKLNLILSHIIKIDNNIQSLDKINIPSEFIDIGISKYYDFFLVKFRKSIYDEKENITDYFSKLSFNHINQYSYHNILIYNISYLSNELSLILFKQNYSIPWMDIKYGKRINRFVLLSFVYFIKKSILENKLNDFRQYITIYINKLEIILKKLFIYYATDTDATLYLNNQMNRRTFSEYFRKEIKEPHPIHGINRKLIQDEMKTNINYFIRNNDNVIMEPYTHPVFFIIWIVVNRIRIMSHDLR